MAERAGGSSRFGPFDPFGLWESMASTVEGVMPAPLTAAAAAAAQQNPVDPVRLALRMARSRLVGRRMTWPTAHGEVALTMTSLDSDLDSIGVASGSTAAITLTASDVTWAGYSFPAGAATLRNVHSRITAAGAELVAAPVDLRLTIPAEVLAAMVARRFPEVGLEIGQDGVPRLSWTRHPSWGSLDLSVEVDGHVVWLRPRQVLTRGRTWSGVHRLPPVWWAARGLPETLRLVSCQGTDGAIVLEARLDEWRYPLARAPWLNTPAEPPG